MYNYYRHILVIIELVNKLKSHKVFCETFVNFLFSSRCGIGKILYLTDGVIKNKLSF